MRKALFLLLLAACGDNKGPDLPPTVFFEQRLHAECARFAKCHLFANVSECRGYFRPRDNEEYLQALDENKLSYDSASAVECLEALETVGCDSTQKDTRTIPSACTRVFRGRVDDGERCAFGDECRSGVCSDIPSCTRDRCCFGACAPSAKRNVEELCAADAQCRDGLYCHKLGVCRERVIAGAACDDIRACDFGSACVGLTALDSGVCRSLPALGEACPYKLCADINARCSNGVCIELGLSGSTCMNNADCSPYALCEQTNGVCTATPTLGMPCEIYCGGASWCDGAKCVAPLPNGDPCDADNQCESTDCFEGPFFDQCNATAVCS